MKYVGSKNRLAKDLVPIIQSYVDNPSCIGYLEPFVGGGNVIDKVKCDLKIGYDIQKYLIALLNKAKLHADDIPDTVTKETYYKVKENPNDYDDWFVGLVGFCASYNSKWFGGYANNVKTKIGTVRNYTDEAIRNLKNQSKSLKDIIFDVKDFRDIKPSDVHNFVIYCDIPYKDTTKYGKQNFPYDEFYLWCETMRETNNVVLISEYWMPDNFKCIWEKDINCTLNHNGREKKTEKLFILKDSIK